MLDLVANVLVFAHLSQEPIWIFSVVAQQLEVISSLLALSHGLCMPDLRITVAVENFDESFLFLQLRCRPHLGRAGKSMADPTAMQTYSILNP